MKPNKGVQGTLHKVSGPLTPDVGIRIMKQIITFSILSLLLGGCTTNPSSRYLDRLTHTKIPLLELNQVSAQEALHSIRAEWEKQTGSQMPVAEITSYYEYVDPKDHLVTIRALDIPFMDAIRYVADLSGYRLTFQEGGLILTDVWPSEYMSFEWTLDTKTIFGLGLGNNPDSHDILEGLSHRGVDISKGDLKVHMFSDKWIVVMGFRENAEMARAVLNLVRNDYQVIKTDESQQGVAGYPPQGVGSPER